MLLSHARALSFFSASWWGRGHLIISSMNCSLLQFLLSFFLRLFNCKGKMLNEMYYCKPSNGLLTPGKESAEKMGCDTRVLKKSQLPSKMSRATILNIFGGQESSTHLRAPLIRISFKVHLSVVAGLVRSPGIRIENKKWSQKKPLHIPYPKYRFMFSSFWSLSHHCKESLRCSSSLFYVPQKLFPAAFNPGFI